MLSVSFDDVSFAYDTNHQLFKKLNLHLTKPDGKARGHVIAVMGPSGTGKTTLLRLICGVERPLSGDISISPKGATLSYLQQQPVLFDHLSLSANARYFQQLHRTQLMFNEHTFDRLVQRLKLKTILGSKRSIHDLSGGERQRLSLLRALSIKPGILLLDEPCSGLDTDVKLEFLQILRSVVDELGLLALYVTHHADEAELIADELLYLEESRADGEAIVHILPIEKAFTSPPTLLAAQSLIGSASNKLPCDVDSTGRLTTSRGELIGSITRGSFEVGQHTLVFPASSLKWNAYSGVPVAVVGQSGFHCFVAIPDGSTLIGAATESPPGFCNIVGFAYLFLESCGVGIKVYISEAAPVDTGVDATERGVTNN